MTLTLVTLLVFLALALIAVCIGIYRQLATYRRLLPCPPDWPSDFSVDRYRPMLRLIDDEDIRFLRSHPGSTPALVKRLRRQRYRVFCGYLCSLELDFHQALEALLLVMVHSHADRRDIVRAVVVCRAKFAFGLWRVRARLFLYRWNLGHEPVARLVSLFEGLQIELQAMVATPGGAGA